MSPAWNHTMKQAARPRSPSSNGNLFRVGAAGGCSRAATLSLMRIGKNTIPHREKTFVLALAVFYLALAVYWQDVSLYDEGFYLEAGTRFLFRSLLHSLSFAPLYALWYRILQIVCPQPVWRYFLSWGLLVAALMTLPLWFRMRGAAVYTWLLVAIPIFGPSNLSIQPNITMFAAVPLLAGMCVVLRRRMDFAGTVFAALIVSFVASFARPEFAYATPLIGVAYLLLSWRTEPHRLRTLGPRWGITACIFIVMTHVIGHSDASRSGIAFAQHYNLRAQAEHKLPVETDAWQSNYALTAFHLDPGRTAAMTRATIGQFAKASPGLFARYVVSNLFARFTLLAGLALAVSLGWPWRHKAAIAMRPASLYLMLVALAPCMSLALIYPDAHYLFPLVPALLLYVTEMSGTGEPLPAKYLPGLFAVAVLLVFWKTSLGIAMETRTWRPQHLTVQTIDCLRNLQQTAPGPNRMIYDAIGLPGVFLLGDRVLTEKWDLSSWAAFSQWIAGATPAWVEVTPAVPRLYGVTYTDVSTLLTSKGYTPHACPAAAFNSPLVIYVAPRSALGVRTALPARLAPSIATVLLKSLWHNAGNDRCGAGWSAGPWCGGYGRCRIDRSPTGGSRGGVRQTRRPSVPGRPAVPADRTCTSWPGACLCHESQPGGKQETIRSVFRHRCRAQRVRNLIKTQVSVSTSDEIEAQQRATASCNRPCRCGHYRYRAPQSARAAFQARGWLSPSR